MPNSLQYWSRRNSDDVSLRAIVFVAAIAAFFTPIGIICAQGSTPHLNPAHLNPAITKLAAGQPIIGLQTEDMSLQNCRHLARVDFDYAYVDFEHGALGLDSLAYCAAAMAGDRAEALKRDNASLKVALFARFPPYGRDTESNDWFIKQALDQGLMGIIFNGIDNADQARRVVQEMRYPQLKTSKYQQPPGMRGYAIGNAIFTWGVNEDEYVKRADLWPLNPNGDLLAIMMIETLDGLKNVDEIASVPGVGGIFVGAGSDLHRYLGVSSAKAPEVEAAFQTILTACKAHNIACGISTTNQAETDKRLKEGWKMIRTVEGAGPSAQ